MQAPRAEEAFVRAARFLHSQKVFRSDYLWRSMTTNRLADMLGMGGASVGREGAVGRPCVFSPTQDPSHTLIR